MTDSENSGQNNTTVWSNVWFWFQFFLWTVMFLFLILLAVFIQDTRSELASQDTSAVVFDSLREFASDDLIQAAELEMLVDRAEQAESRAQGYLGIFEALSFATAVFGGLVVAVGFAAAVAGVRNYRGLMRDISESRDASQQAQQKLEDTIDKLDRRIDERADQISQSVSDGVKKATLALALMPLAHRQYVARDLDGALQTYERIIRLDPENPIPNYHIGYIYTQKKELDRAEEALLRAQTLDNQLPQIKAGLGFVYRRRGDQTKDKAEQRQHYLRAEKFLLDALENSRGLVDDDGESWWGVLGGLEKRRKNFSKARDHYLEAREVTPQSSYPFLNLALIALETNDIETADNYFDKAKAWSHREILAELGNYWAHADYLTVTAVRGEDTSKALEDFLSVLPEDVKDVLERVIASMQSIRDKYAEYDSQRADVDKQKEIGTLDKIITRLKVEQERRKEKNPVASPSNEAND